VPGPGRLVLRLPGGLRIGVGPKPSEPLRTVQRPIINGATKYAQGEVRKALDSLGLAPGDLVLVACSGGADSLALAAVAQRAAHNIGKTTRKRGFAIRVGAVIIDHQLQPGSAQVAQQAAQQCQKLGLNPVRVVKVEVPSQGAGGLEAAARSARYQALEQTAIELGAEAVLLGHTLDDQAEQVLLGLARGSGAKSLGGMPDQRGLFLRPFLHIRRSTTEFLCDWHGLRPWRDPTNAKPVHLRNRVRLQAMPVLEEVLGPGVPEALARTAEQLKEDAEALDYYATQLFVEASQGVSTVAATQLLNRPGGHQVSLDVEVLLTAPVAVRRRALRKAAITAGAPASAMSRTQVLTLDALVANWHGQSAHTLPGSVVASRKCGRLWFAK